MKKFIFSAGVLLAAVMFSPSTAVKAENASVTFGSAGYDAEENDTFQVGVYIRCDAPDFIYNVTVQYDAARMEYLGGADGGGNGMLQFAGKASGGECQYMLSFRALSEGAGTVSVTDASVITDPAEEQGEGAMGAGAEEGAAQDVPVVADITQLGSASVQVSPSIDCTLSGLGIAQLPDFSLEPGVYEYDLTVPSDTQSLDISPSLQDDRANVDISDTALQPGENTITVTVSGGNESTQYLLHVVRQEAAEIHTEEQETLPAQAVPETAQAAPAAVTKSGPAEDAAAQAPSAEAFSEEEGNREESAAGVSFPERIKGFMEENARKLLPAAGAILLLVVAGAAVWLVRRRKKDAGYFDEDEEDDWIDLTTDEKWLNWLEEIEEEEMDAVLIRANLREKKEEPALLTDCRDVERKGQASLYSPERVKEWVEENEAGRRDAPGYARKPRKAQKPAAPDAPKPTAPAPKQAALVQKPSVPAAPKQTAPAQKPAASAPKPAAPAPAPAAPTVIRVNDVSMRFKISDVNATSLKEYLLAAVKRQNKYHELEALKHISFDVRKGEVIGIVGTNGSGKSTLLKLIAGVLKPSEGSIEVDHKKVQLLTLGTGFDAELTARENVYLNGAIIGYSKEFIDENYENIVQFAELDGFMDEKIKNFSSGMMSRLGFAIATAGKTAEILILDEVLSVGDMFFRQKSEKRIKEMIHSGSTVLIVSHSTDTIIKNCNRAIWIEKGVLMEIGEPKKVCAAYRKKAG